MKRKREDNEDSSVGGVRHCFLRIPEGFLTSAQYEAERLLSRQKRARCGPQAPSEEDQAKISVVVLGKGKAKRKGVEKTTPHDDPVQAREPTEKDRVA